MADNPVLPTKTGWVIIALMIAGAWWGYTTVRGDADGRIHIYNSDKRRAEVKIVFTGTGEVLENYQLKRFGNATFSTNRSGNYEVLIPSHKKRYNVYIDQRGFGTFKEPLINIGADREIYLEPVFYVSRELSKQEQNQRVRELSKKYRAYEFERAYTELPVHVDYGFGESIPIQKGGMIYVRPRRRFFSFLGVGASDAREAYYYLGDSARRLKVKRLLQ